MEQPRNPAGTPNGGKWAKKGGAEPDIALETDSGDVPSEHHDQLRLEEMLDLARGCNQDSLQFRDADELLSVANELHREVQELRKRALQEKYGEVVPALIDENITCPGGTLYDRISEIGWDPEQVEVVRIESEPEYDDNNYFTQVNWVAFRDKSVDKQLAYRKIIQAAMLKHHGKTGQFPDTTVDSEYAISTLSVHDFTIEDEDTIRYGVLYLGEQGPNAYRFRYEDAEDLVNFDPEDIEDSLLVMGDDGSVRIKTLEEAEEHLDRGYGDAAS